MERKCWVTLLGMDLYPNMYVVLTGAPGSGKSIAINPIEKFWRVCPALKIAPTTITKAGLIDELDAAKRTVTPGPGHPIMQFSSLQVASSEFGNLCPAYDQPFMNVLTDIYDCRDRFEERTRMAGERLKINNPQINILAGTQPDYLSAFLPEVAWGQGFMSRVLIIYSDYNARSSLFTDKHFDRKLRASLEHDINRIMSLTGEFSWGEGVCQRLDEWHLSGGEPRPSHMRLVNYNTRRHIHLVKLAMVYSAARGDSLMIEMCDYENALATLLEAEAAMPMVFRAMVAGGNAALVHDAYQYLKELYAKGGNKPVAERELVKFIHARINSRDVLTILQTMEACGFIEKVGMDPKSGKGMYAPAKEPDPPRIETAKQKVTAA